MGRRVARVGFAQLHRVVHADHAVGLRTLEAAVIAVGVVPLIAGLALAGTDPTASGVLVAFHNGTFLVGPGFVVGVNTVLMAYLMYRSGLVPRFIPVLGLVGGPLVFLSATGELFGPAALQHDVVMTGPVVPVR